MRIRRLGWAGIELEHEGAKIAIDAIGTLGFFEEFWGPEDERDELIALAPESLDGALVTHLHRDHTDPEALAVALKSGAPLAGPARPRFLSQLQQFAVGQVEEALGSEGIDRQALTPGESLQIGPFEAIACSSVDGVGANQIAWLVKAGDQSVLHCGDTLWHGYWWDIAEECGAPDIACLPGNGVEIDFLINDPPANQAVDLTPEQSVDAARALKAARMLPMHFSRTYEHERMYRPIVDAEARIRAAAGEHDLELLFPEIGEWIDVAAPVAA